jgi:hypothetical protein
MVTCIWCIAADQVLSLEGHQTAVAKVEGGGAIIRGRSGAIFPTGLGGRETGRGAVPTASAFP